MLGWVKLHRNLTQWGWYDDSNTKAVFLHLLLMAQHEPKLYRGVQLEKGQLITGRHTLAKVLGLTEQQVRTCITRLKSTNEITTKTTNKFTVVTLTNWAKYQLDEEKTTSKTTNKTTAQQPTNNQQTTTYKNDKNVNNEKEVYVNAQKSLKQEMHEAEAWQQSVMLHVAQYRVLTAKDMFQYIETFFAEIEATGEHHTMYSARKHFTHWLSKKVKPTPAAPGTFNPRYKML